MDRKRESLLKSHSVIFIKIKGTKDQIEITEISETTEILGIIETIVKTVTIESLEIIGVTTEIIGTIVTTEDLSTETIITTDMIEITTIEKFVTEVMITEIIGIRETREIKEMEVTMEVDETHLLNGED